MGTAFGQVIDYLFAGTVTVSVSPLFGQTLKTQLQAVAPNVVLTDNLYIPGGLVDSDFTVMIGRQSLTSAASSVNQVRLVLGQFKVDEDFTVPILILCRSMGPDQKTVRDKGLGLFDAVAHWVHQDLTLNSVLLGGRSAVITDYTITQTETDEDQGRGVMQTAMIAINLQAKNHYLP